MRPSIARVNEQLDMQFAASRHTTAPNSLHLVACKLLLISRLTESRRLSWPSDYNAKSWLYSSINVINL